MTAGQLSLCLSANYFCKGRSDSIADTSWIYDHDELLLPGLFLESEYINLFAYPFENIVSGVPIYKNN